MMTPIKKVLLGFDGSVDYSVRPIRTAGKTNQYFATIADFGNYISSKAGLSCSIQNELIKCQAGGNAVFMAQSLKRLGYDVFLAGLLGEGERSAAFLALERMGIELCSYGDSRFCECYEFDDGKIMISHQASDMPAPFEKLCDAMGPKLSLFHDADLVAMLNWGEIRWMDQVWDIASEYLCEGTNKSADKYVFFDPADLSCRSSDEVKHMLDSIKKASRSRRCILSINENEAVCLSNSAFHGRGEEDLLKCLVEGRYVDEAVVHTLHHTVAYDGACLIHEAVDHVEKPLISTGAGDHFNGGYCGALLCGSSLQNRVRAANRSAYHYLTTGTQAGPEILA